MENITNTLSILGLSDKEARVYMALLSLGRGSAYGVADKAGLKKPTAYVILDELIKKGFVFKIPRSKKQLFVAKPPKEVLATAEERMRQVVLALPMLERLADENKAEVKTIYFEGLRGFEKAFEYRLEEMKDKEIVGFYAKAESNTPQELWHLSKKWSKKAHQNGIKIRGFAPDDASLAEYRTDDKKFGREFKKLPLAEYSSNTSIEAGDIFVRISLNSNIQAVIIENPDLAKTVRQIFEMMWALKK